ncbi:MAG: hypothetical protein LBJ59_05020 [Zoogloeaceae bacterium]|jgi:hypothetical protein|nr:hypothetical protein [Zoogloeaceae bacterium]
MIAAGELLICANCRQGQVDIRVRLERPDIARFFVGMSGEQVVAAAPLIYTLCGRAQQAAAAAALAVAAGRPPPPIDDDALWREHLHACLWRLCLDWPMALARPLAEQEAARSAFAHWHRQTRTSPAVFARATKNILYALAANLPVEPSPIHALCNAQWEKAQKAWRALQKNAPYPLVARGKNGVGAGRTQTARGTLTHVLRLHAGRIGAYRVHTPTDRHFANAAPLTAQFNALCAIRRENADNASLRQILECATLALDPCVPHRLEWRESA